MTHPGPAPTSVGLSPAGKRSIRTRDDYRKFAMNQYAEAFLHIRGEGVILRFKPNLPGGDFAYFPYKWSPCQPRCWKQAWRVPRRAKILRNRDKLLLQSIHIPTEKDHIHPATGGKSDIRISKEQFLRLEHLAQPGMRIWVLDPETPHCVMLPSRVFSFTEEEKEKYHSDKFMEDGSDLPTLNNLIDRLVQGESKEVSESSLIDELGLTVEALDEIAGQKGASQMCILL